MTLKVGAYTEGSKRKHYVPQYWYNSEAPYPLALCGVAVSRSTLKEGTSNCSTCVRMGKAYNR